MRQYDLGHFQRHGWVLIENLPKAARRAPTYCRSLSLATQMDGGS